MVLVSCFNQLVKQGNTVAQAAYEGALMRLRPVLMTSVTTIFGLLPLLLLTGAGAEVQRPLATVVVFGMASSTILTLLVLPAVYAVVEGRSVQLAQD
jgi:cobalt-zinc-cadmium resistance protein CzcA